MYVYIFVHVCMLYICVFVCKVPTQRGHDITRKYILVCIYIYTHMFTCIFIYLYKYIYIYICVYLCMYMYVYIYIYIYTTQHNIHPRTQRCVCVPAAAESLGLFCRSLFNPYRGATRCPIFLFFYQCVPGYIGVYMCVPMCACVVCKMQYVMEERRDPYFFFLPRMSE